MPLINEIVHVLFINLFNKYMLGTFGAWEKAVNKAEERFLTKPTFSQRETDNRLKKNLLASW